MPRPARCGTASRSADIEASTGALHDAAVGVGEVVVCRGLGHTERALVASALGNALVIARPALVVGAAAALDVGVALVALPLWLGTASLMLLAW